MMVTSQSSWRSSQGDFSDPETPVRMIFKMTFTLLLADSFLSGLHFSLISLYLCGESMASLLVVLHCPDALKYCLALTLCMVPFCFQRLQTFPPF